MTIEESNGVHSKENYPNYKGKTTSDRYGEHIKINDTSAVESNEIIDVNKRGKVQDITDKKFVESEPTMTE